MHSDSGQADLLIFLFKPLCGEQKESPTVDCLDIELSPVEIEKNIGVFIHRRFPDFLLNRQQYDGLF